MAEPEAYCSHPGCLYREGHDGPHSVRAEPAIFGGGLKALMGATVVSARIIKAGCMPEVTYPNVELVEIEFSHPDESVRNFVLIVPQETAKLWCPKVVWDPEVILEEETL